MNAQESLPAANSIKTATKEAVEHRRVCGTGTLVCYEVISCKRLRCVGGLEVALAMAAARRSRASSSRDLLEHEHGSARATATRGNRRSCREQWRAGSGTTRRRVLERIQSGGEARGTTATTATTQQNSELVGAPRTRRWHGSSDDSGDRIAMEKSRIGFGYT